MLKLVSNNAFRVLGVYANASKKEITANSTKLKAYLKVGKSVEFPSDMPNLLGPVERTAESIDAALAKLNLPEDKILQALFWFVDITPLDKAALSNIAAGEFEKATEILDKRECLSSWWNNGILDFVDNNPEGAFINLSCLIHDEEYRGEFVNLVCGETFSISESELAHKFLDALLEEIPAGELYSMFVANVDEPKDCDYLKGKAVEEPISKINAAIEKAKNLDRTNADANYNTGLGLINSTQVALKMVKDLLGEGDLTYQHVADNLAQTILQCGINYYNNSEEPQSIEKALYIQQYAQRIAAGAIVKERCQKNVAILKKQKEEGAIKDDLEFLAGALKSFHNGTKSITATKMFINKCKPHLDSMKSALGASNDLYLQISSAIANNALGVVIKVVNDAQSGPYPDISSLSSTISSAQECMNLIGALDMTSQERNHFSTNKTSLANLALEVSKILLRRTSYTPSSSSTTYSSSSSSSSSSGGNDTNWGCIWMAIIGFIIFIIAAVAG